MVPCRWAHRAVRASSPRILALYSSDTYCWPPPHVSACKLMPLNSVSATGRCARLSSGELLPSGRDACCCRRRDAAASAPVGTSARALSGSGDNAGGDDGDNAGCDVGGACGGRSAESASSRCEARSTRSERTWPSISSSDVRRANSASRPGCARHSEKYLCCADAHTHAHMPRAHATIMRRTRDATPESRERRGGACAHRSVPVGDVGRTGGSHVSVPRSVALAEQQTERGRRTRHQLAQARAHGGVVGAVRRPRVLGRCVRDA
jgi:hypothetical protein